MADLGDGLKNLFLAGVGAVAYTGEKGKEIIDLLVEKGELTWEQGRELNEEFKRKAAESRDSMREGALEATMRAMSPEDRAAFAAKAAAFAEQQNAEDAARAAAEAEARVEEAAEEAAQAVEETAEAVVVEVEAEVVEAAEAAEAAAPEAEEL